MTKNEPQVMTLQELTKRLLMAKLQLRTWRAVGARFAITGAMAYRIALQGYEPKDPHIRTLLHLPALAPAPVCAKCGQVHTTKRCTANRKPKRTAPMTDLEAAFSFLARVLALPDPVREHRFLPDRLYRFDFAWPDRMLAVECEGGVWTNGAHTRGGHYESDCEKYSLAALAGWKVMRFTVTMLEDGRAEAILRKAFESEEL